MINYGQDHDFKTLMHIFNTPIECGFRALFVLSASHPNAYDLQRLISYDYLIVHSSDVDNAPPSLHPPVPFRGAEWVVKRDLLESGLKLMFSRELVGRNFTKDGIVYEGTDLTAAFISLLKTNYAEELKIRAKWIVSTFEQFSDRELQSYMSSRVGSWGGEFESLSAIGDIEL